MSAFIIFMQSMSLRQRVEKGGGERGWEGSSTDRLVSRDVISDGK